VAGLAGRADGDLGAAVDPKRCYSLMLTDANTYNFG
jgi:hypothetical protein